MGAFGVWGLLGFLPEEEREAEALNPEGMVVLEMLHCFWAVLDSGFFPKGAFAEVVHLHVVMSALLPAVPPRGSCQQNVAMAA